MANLQIKNVPEPLHEELRRRAAGRSMTVRDYVLELIRDDQRRPTMEEWLEELDRREPIDIGGSAADLVKAGRDERDEQLARARRR
jgi:hypothetical protein